MRCTFNENEEGVAELMVQLEYTGRLPVWPDSSGPSDAEEAIPLIQSDLMGSGRDHLLAVVFLRLNEQLGITRNTGFVNGGATIDLRIPIQLSATTANLPEKPRRETHILLVEDHPMQQIATKRILNAWSELVTVSIAGDGQKALEMVRENAYGIVLMDLQMPGMNGWDTVTHLRHFTSVPIIALTASNSKQEEDRCYRVGFNDYLTKPFQPEDLYRRIMMLIHEEE